MGKALNVGLVVTESSWTEPEKHDTSSRSGNDSYAEDADSKPVNDKEPMADVYLNAEDNVHANDNSMLSNSNSIMKKGLTRMLNNEKVFANAALKNEIGKLKGNSVDTKFIIPSILGKPDLQPLINQSVVR
ncbi:hypothetical protein Tco_1116386 [Tanacetum coccineum]